MAQAFDMRRLHMGCGESLRRQLPLPVSLKLLPKPASKTVIDRNGAETVTKDKTQPDESR